MGYDYGYSHWEIVILYVWYWSYTYKAFDTYAQGWVIFLYGIFLFWCMVTPFGYDYAVSHSEPSTLIPLLSLYISHIYGL